MVKVLISDKLSPLAKEIFERRGIEVDQIVGLSKEELEGKIHEYDGLAIRSATKVTPKILAAAKKLKVVGNDIVLSGFLLLRLNLYILLRLNLCIQCGKAFKHPLYLEA